MSKPEPIQPALYAIAAFALLRLILATFAPLTPQEAYYWTWSRFPDLSYYDHPPLASYAIAATTALFGQTILGIKASAILWSVGWNMLLVRLVDDMFHDRRVTLWSVVTLNLTILYELFGFGPTPDGPLMFGWIGAVWAVWRATHAGASSAGETCVAHRWWYLAGVFMGLAWLGKYAGVLLVPIVGCYLLAVPAHRHWLRRPQPWLAILIAVLLFSPVLWWNAQHGWVSMLFQSAHRFNGMDTFRPRFVVVLVVTQFLLLTPFLFATSLSALWRNLRDVVRDKATPAMLLLVLNALLPLLLFTFTSFRSNAKMNWLLPAWWSLLVLAVYHWHQSDRGLRFMRWGLASSAAVLAATAAIALQPRVVLPGDLNVSGGWRQTGAKVEELVREERAQGRNAFVFSPNYKISSLLWFHRPSQERTYAQEILGHRALQYDYFPVTATLRGATGFLVLSNQRQSQVDLEEVRRLFDSLEFVGKLVSGNKDLSPREIEIWKGTGYRGRPTTNPPASIQDFDI